MWPRIAEVALGLWLAMSPFIFGHGPDEGFLWANDFAVGAVVVTLGLLGCWSKTEKAHLLQLGVCVYLVLVAFIAGGEPPPGPPYQNYMVVALLLLILGVIPTRATLPPRGWQQFYEERARTQE